LYNCFNGRVPRVLGLDGGQSLMEIFGDCCNGVFYRLDAVCFAYATVSK